MLVIGVAPDRARWFTRSHALEVRVDDRVVHAGPATAVVVANGQFLRGADLVPRGHPGDGRLEVQVYAVGRSARAGVRARLPQGIHLPHPQIVQASGRRIEIVSGPASSPTPVAVELDGVALVPAGILIVSVVPEAFALLV
jgi:diacylglycerol kinase family enzyme